MTIVHRFTSPAWHDALKSHLAALSSKGNESNGDSQDIFNQIVRLNTGQALIFSPSAMLGVDDQHVTGSSRIAKLGTQYVKVLIRHRTTVDGGRSILANKVDAMCSLDC